MENEDHISDEKNDLKHISGKRSQQPFEPTDDYFDNFVSNLENSIDDFEELKMHAPLLSTLPKYDPFTTPPGYFDELPFLIQQRISVEKPFRSFLDTIILLIKPRFAIPFIATVLIAFAGINFMERHAESAKTAHGEETSYEEQLSGIDESLIIEKLNPPNDMATDTVPEEDNSIERYLIDNNVDETVLN